MAATAAPVSSSARWKGPGKSVDAPTSPLLRGMVGEARRVGAAVVAQVQGESLAIRLRGLQGAGHFRRLSNWSLPKAGRAVGHQRGLTPRSSGPPTAWRLGRVAVLFIIVHAAKAPHRWRPLNSHVRRRNQASSVRRLKSMQAAATVRLRQHSRENRFGA
jgi:hypothetical protein